MECIEIKQAEAGGSRVQGQPGLYRERLECSSVAAYLAHLHKVLGSLSSTFKRKANANPES